MRNRFVSTEKKTVEAYRGLTVHADPGVHAQIASLLAEIVEPPASVLDIGAGAGAFSRRLHDLGYQVTAVDADETKWRADEIPFTRIDPRASLTDFVEGTFHAVCCLEVIEHVEDQWRLMRDINRVLKPGGHAIISTPNVTSFASRLRFLRQGRFLQFEDSDLSYGHISPITPFEFSVLAKGTGFEQQQVVPCGYLPVLDLSERSVRSFVRAIATTAAYVLARGEKHGWVVAFVVRRAE